MVREELNLNEMPVQGQSWYVTLQKDNKPICRAECSDVPFEPSSFFTITRIEAAARVQIPVDMPQFQLYPRPQDLSQKTEWGIFLKFLQNHKRVAIVESDICEYYIRNLSEGPEFNHATVFYKMQNAHSSSHNREHGNARNASNGREQNANSSTHNCESGNARSAFNGQELDNAQSAYYSREPKKTQCVPANQEVGIPGEVLVESKSVKVVTDSVRCDPHEDSNSKCLLATPAKDNSSQRNYVRIDPSYLRTLSQAHSGWIFGAIAELVDNSRDAKANRLDISIESLYSKKNTSEIPVLSVIDDGQGMSHLDIMRMVSFGHKQPEEEDLDRIGRFGIGFKTGAMKLGRDALILTQTSSSRSIAFFSQSFNENKENVEIPVVTYCKHGQYMEFDLRVQSEIIAEDNLRTIKEHSPFNEYLIGDKLSRFGAAGTGTQIFIWNLEKWGSNYSLEWVWGTPSEATHQSQGDIFIRSRRIRARPGQISTQVPLDYSLQAYLEVLFLYPHMKIYVQGFMVKTRPLATSLNKTITVEGEVMGKPIQLILGRSREEYERVNCGIFLYWHGRLIEAYKRVGSMMHSSDTGRGVVGIADITNTMDDANGEAWVLNNKQGFQDCEAYAEVEKWLGYKTTEYWDDNFDKLTLKKGSQNYKPDHDWVQCDRCRKWRILSPQFNKKSLPRDWFCYMPPFSGSCESPLQQMGHGIITVAAGRTGHGSEQMTNEDNEETQMDSSISEYSDSGTKSKNAKPSSSYRKLRPALIDDSPLNFKNASSRQRATKSGCSTLTKGKRKLKGDDGVGDSIQTDNGNKQPVNLKRRRRCPRKRQS